jgi:hypothetical protein
MSSMESCFMPCPRRRVRFGGWLGILTAGASLSLGDNGEIAVWNLGEVEAQLAKLGLKP